MIPNADFTIVSRTKRPTPKDTAFERARDRLRQRSELIRSSELFMDIVKILESWKPSSTDSWSKVRCLALGSPIEEDQANYQLALLCEIGRYFSIDMVSLYDPAFTKEDNLFLSSECNFQVEESFESQNMDDVLFFVPHTPIVLLESLFANKPKYILTNDVSTYTNKFTTKEYFEKYPLCATVCNSIGTKIDDGFTVVKRRNKHVTTQTKVQLPKIAVLCHKINPHSKGPWAHAFSDLCLYAFN
ncbi:hypothetical protein KL921_001234 [Ogataea angusta]|uniref:SRR1-like domain-containing protein n=1 Tax=Pichia angusta TaxID=870730 RepID=A0ABQ7S2X1_PICAN|nr:hypothetical protein KL921_001234 [Ogataea angusta]KAG7836441.1 hypothetical protein KL943_002090 [Ogataea angusta]KAG7843508.1 hypothetical protein KL942_000604 [Ogataea angusta]KAG7851725.1 hypothetical protein KL941_001394 [Ogataea angusta]KAG7852338.1 hypothetical protein KL940_000039 [Ogataea angusta]